MSVSPVLLYYWNIISGYNCIQRKMNEILIYWGVPVSLLLLSNVTDVAFLSSKTYLDPLCDVYIALSGRCGCCWLSNRRVLTAVIVWERSLTNIIMPLYTYLSNHLWDICSVSFSLNDTCWISCVKDKSFQIVCKVVPE